MDIKLISSENNLVIKHVRSLQLKKQRMKNLQFVVEGVRIVGECLKHGGDIEYVLYSEELHKVAGGSDLLDSILNQGLTVYELPDQLFNKLSDTDTPQGIMAVVKMTNNSLDNIEFKNENNLFFVILDRIQDPGNMGTIIRTAESANVDAIILTKGSVDPYNAKTIRATMGAIFHLPIIQCENEEWMKFLKDRNVNLVAADLDTDKTYIDINWKQNIGIVVGNEANGIDEDILFHVDERVIIPILGKIESLNASIAAGILIYKAAEEKYLKRV